MKKKSPTEQLTLAGTEEGEILARLQERVEKAIATIQELRRDRDSWKESGGSVAPLRCVAAQHRAREADEVLDA